MRILPRHNVTAESKCSVSLPLAGRIQSRVGVLLSVTRSSDAARSLPAAVFREAGSTVGLVGERNGLCLPSCALLHAASPRVRRTGPRGAGESMRASRKAAAVGDGGGNRRDVPS